MHKTWAREFVTKRESVNLWGAICRIKTVGIKPEKHDIKTRGINWWNHSKETDWTWEERTVAIKFERRKLNTQKWAGRGERSIETARIDNNGALCPK